ncbi:MAG TPA: ABC transporter substrate-binding protein [Methylomirabilota bacterium]|nr:ABC transporter substrate-binding protein [Methylomirabilota bacterium]
MWRRGAYVFGALIGVMVLFGAALPDPAAAESNLVVGVWMDLKTLDPPRMKTGAEYNYAMLVFNGLTAIGRNMTVEPDLATKWDVSPDLKTWTFQLRRGVKFHNGKELDAGDVIHTVNRILDPKVGSPLRGGFGIVDRMEAVDKYTLRFTLKEPYGELAAIFADYQARILPAGVGDEQLAKSPVGTGPFKFVEFKPEDRVVLEKNPNYWEPGLPKLDKVTFRIIPERATAVAALKSSEVHLVWAASAEQQQSLKGSDTAAVDMTTSATWIGLIMHNGQPPFNDVRVRQAFFHLLDKPAIAELATLGNAVATHSPIPPGHPFYRSDIPIPKPDPAKARQLLKEAGITSGPDLKLYYAARDTEAQRAAVTIRDQVKAAGVKIDLEGVPADKFYAEVEGKVPLAITTFYGRAVPDAMLYHWYHSNGSWNQNLWHYSNKRMDDLLTRARQTTNTGQQKELYGEVQKIVVDEGPGAVLYVKTHANGVHKLVKGFKSHPRMWLDVKSVTLGN